MMVISTQNMWVNSIEYDRLYFLERRIGIYRSFWWRPLSWLYESHLWFINSHLAIKTLWVGHLIHNCHWWQWEFGYGIYTIASSYGYSRLMTGRYTSPPSLEVEVILWWEVTEGWTSWGEPKLVFDACQIGGD